MSMNIKSDEAHELARALAELADESITQAVTVALRERLERLRRLRSTKEERSAALLAIGRDAAARLTATARAVDHGELLYDEQGLPR